MPPRRSTRRASESVEPQAEPELGSKRKRSVAPEQEKENVEKPTAKTKASSSKPASTARRAPSSRASSVGATSAAATTTRRVSKRNQVMQEVAEEAESDQEDDQDEDDPPPKKKSRPSDEGARPTRRGGPKKVVVSDSEPEDADAAVPEDDDPDSDFDEPVSAPKKSTAKSASKKAGTAAKAKTTTAKGKTAVKVKAEPKPKVAQPAAGVNGDDDDDVEISTRSPQRRKSTKAPEPEGDTDNEEDLLSSTQPTGTAGASSSTIGGPRPSLAAQMSSSMFIPPPIDEDDGKPKSRLVIHKLVMQDFKSYRGKQVIGPFHKSFSAIVGPNGSGKSNTIDALLFVFGYRASKMRQGKVGELIYNGVSAEDADDDENNGNPNECTVEVYFREIIDLDGDNYDIVPGSKLVVARTGYRNNSSKYTLNGKSSTFKDVRDLLMGKGIDLEHNRFLILQGEVESIALMKPKGATEHDQGLLEYLEDIIGTTRFVQPISQALEEIGELSETRTIAMNRVRSSESEKAELAKRRKAALEWLKLKNEWVHAKSRLLQWEMWKAFEKVSVKEAEVNKLNSELEKLRQGHEEDIKHLEDLKKHYKMRQEAYAEVAQLAKAAEADLAKYEKSQISLQETMKSINSKVKKCEKILKEDNAALKKAERTIEESAAKIETESKKIEDNEKKLVKEEKELEVIQDGLKDKTQVFNSKIEEKQKELQPWNTQINKCQADLTLATSERGDLLKKAENAREQLEQAEQALEALKQAQTEQVEEHKSLKNRKANLHSAIGEAEKRLATAKKQVSDSRERANLTRQKAQEARSSQAENRSQGKVLDGLNNLKNAGRINGFHGRLGGLGKIDKKYDVAVTTACGALNNMVVDTVDQGQRCIEYLRAQNLGRASFMVLEKLGINSRNMDRIQTPENVPRLFDLITPAEDRFKPAFYKAVADTLVADNLEQANRLAFGGGKRWRVVTLTGQLIDTSGTMSGGGSKPQSGGMSSKFAAETVSPEALAKLERDSNEAQRMLDEANRELDTAESELEDLRKSGPTIDLSYNKLGMAIETGKHNLLETENRVADLKTKNKPIPADVQRVKTLEREIASHEASLAKLQLKTKEIQDAIKDLEEKILEIGGSKLLAQKSKVEGLKTYISISTEEVTKAEVAEAHAEREIKKYTKSVAKNEAALEEAVAEQDECSAKLEQVGKDVKQYKDHVNKAKAAADSAQDDLDKIKKQVDEADDDIQAFRKQEVDLGNKITDAQKIVDEGNRYIDLWREEHDALQLEEVDDDDDDEPEVNSERPAEASEPSDPQVKPDPDAGDPEDGEGRQKSPSQELPIYSAEELARMQKRELLADTELLDEQLQKMKPDLSVLAEYKKVDEVYQQRVSELDRLTAERDGKKQQYDDLRKERLNLFMVGFNAISLKLKELYQMITLGGNAELELVDSMDPFSEGIIFSVMPPKKSWKNISNLSGGEKTLSSLALVFALHVYKPTPLYFMDEIDAALDFRNVSIVANYIKDRTKNAQFIIISLRNDMFELSQRLIGIYKTANATKSVAIHNRALPKSESVVAAAA